LKTIPVCTGANIITQVHRVSEQYKILLNSIKLTKKIK
jgi:hypothetical protein